MCLITKQKWWRWATKDIHCFKVLRVSYPFGKLDKREVCTPYMDVTVPEKVLTGEDTCRSWGVAGFNYGHYKEEKVWIIEGGALHAFTNERAAVAAISKSFISGAIVFECIIPKGTRYAVGLENEICAKKLRFVKKIYGF